MIDEIVANDDPKNSESKEDSQDTGRTDRCRRFVEIVKDLQIDLQEVRAAHEIAHKILKLQLEHDAHEARFKKDRQQLYSQLGQIVDGGTLLVPEAAALPPTLANLMFHIPRDGTTISPSEICIEIHGAVSPKHSSRVRANLRRLLERKIIKRPHRGQYMATSSDKATS